MRFATTTWRPQSLEKFKPNFRIYCFGAASSSRLYSAHNLFDKSPDRDRENYTSLLFGFSRDGRTQEATRLFLNIHRLGMEMDCSIFSSVLKVSATLCDELFGRLLHCQCIKFGFLDDVSVGTSLVDTYMKGSNFKDGRNVFDEMKERNVVTWTTLISGYARNSLNEEVLTLFMRMQDEGTQPNSFTFAAALGVLAEEGVGGRGLQVHTVVVKNGLDQTIPVSNSLINLYLKCGNVRKARILFDKTEVKSVVTWNSMISGYAANGLDLEALGMFYSMRLNHVRLSESSFASIIKLCANLKELRFTEQLHCSVVKYGFVFDQNIRTALMVAYSKCMAMLDALRLFKETGFLGNVVSWTAMISGFLQNDGKEEAVDLFSEMKRKGVRPNEFTYSVILTALPAISPSEVHAQVVKTNYERSSTVGTALLDAYVKLGKVDEAAKVFSGIDNKDIVAWSAMLAGYACRICSGRQEGEYDEDIKSSSAQDQGITERWNWFKSFPREKDIQVTSQQTSNEPDGDQQLLIGGFQPDQKDLSYEVNFPTFLTHQRSSSNWIQDKTNFGLEDIKFLNQKIPGFPYLEADGFSHLQTKLWRPGDSLNQLEALRRLIRRGLNQSFSRYKGDQTYHNWPRMHLAFNAQCLDTYGQRRNAYKLPYPALDESYHHQASLSSTA